MARSTAAWESSYAERALDALADAVLVVDARQKQIPLVMSNAAARAALAAGEASEVRGRPGAVAHAAPLLGAPLLGAPLHGFIAARSATDVDAALAAASMDSGAVNLVVTWRMRGGQSQFATTFSRLDCDLGQCLILVTIAVVAPEPRLAMAVEELPVDLLILDRNLRISFANPAAAASNGARAATLLGCSALSVVPTAAIPKAVFRRALEGRAYHQRDVALAGKRAGVGGDAPRCFEVFVQPLTAAGQVVGLIVLSLEASEPSGTQQAASEAAAERRLKHELLEASSRERHSIGRDLHDGIGQELTGLALMLRGLAARLQSTCPSVSGSVEEIVGVVNQSIESVRGLARGLMPVSVERGGLCFALKTLADRSRSHYGLEVTFRADVWPELRMDETTANHLYRIAQEALSNAARHGQARSVEIYLMSTPASFLLRVTDDGCGIAQPLPATRGLGLKTMEFRAGVIGATLEVAQQAPRGTIVRVVGRHALAGQPSMMDNKI